MARYFLIVGEASGDMHAARLITALRQRDPQAEFAGLGGDKMQDVGCRLYQHYRNMAYMGYVAVFTHLKEIRANIRIAQQALLREQPDELILIDYPGFNLPMAKFAKRHLAHTRITYSIPPKIWAWKRWRVHSIGKYCDRILGIFPFEPAFYARYGYDCTYVGNPTSEAITDYLSQHSVPNAQSPTRSPQHEVINTKSQYVALLPGSRLREVENCLPKMLLAAEQAIDGTDIRRIVVTQAPGIDPELYKQLCAGHPLAKLTTDTYDAVLHARAAIVNSGTATLETALLGCPQVAVYHLSFGHLLGFLRPVMFRIPHFTLVNIVSKREVIKELLAYEFTVESTRDELRRLLTDTVYTQQMCADYKQLQQLLGTSRAAETAATIIQNRLTI